MKWKAKRDEWFKKKEKRNINLHCLVETCTPLDLIVSKFHKSHPLVFFIIIIS